MQLPRVLHGERRTFASVTRSTLGLHRHRACAMIQSLYSRQQCVRTRSIVGFPGQAWQQHVPQARVPPGKSQLLFWKLPCVLCIAASVPHDFGLCTLWAVSHDGLERYDAYTVGAFSRADH